LLGNPNNKDDNLLNSMDPGSVQGRVYVSSENKIELVLEEVCFMLSQVKEPIVPAVDAMTILQDPKQLALTGVIVSDQGDSVQ
jgi:hypothetical protein